MSQQKTNFLKQVQLDAFLCQRLLKMFESLQKPGTETCHRCNIDEISEQKKNHWKEWDPKSCSKEDSLLKRFPCLIGQGIVSPVKSKDPAPKKKTIKVKPTLTPTLTSENFVESRISEGSFGSTWLLCSPEGPVRHSVLKVMRIKKGIEVTGVMNEIIAQVLMFPFSPELFQICLKPIENEKIDILIHMQRLDETIHERFRFDLTGWDQTRPLIEILKRFFEKMKSINIFHCDLGPHNIMFDFDGKTKIIDFGRVFGDQVPLFTLISMCYYWKEWPVSDFKKFMKTLIDQLSREKHVDKSDQLLFTEILEKDIETWKSEGSAERYIKELISYSKKASEFYANLDNSSKKNRLISEFKDALNDQNKDRWEKLYLPVMQIVDEFPKLVLDNSNFERFLNQNENLKQDLEQLKEKQL